MKKILIIGGAGFIGSNITAKLFKNGYTVTIFDSFSPQIHGDKKNSQLYKSVKDIANVITGDVCNKKDWLNIIKGHDAVIYLAAETGTAQSMYEITKYNQTNILGLSNFYENLITSKHSLKKIIIASSRSIYGEGKYYSEKYGFVYPSSRNKKDLLNQDFNVKCSISKLNLQAVATDEESKINPSSIYAISKYQQEQISFLMGKTLDIPTIALRYQNVYGPGQSLTNPYTGILSVLSTRILNNNDIDIYEDGNQSRDFVYIDDVVEATILALERDTENKIFNVGSGTPTTVYDVAKILKEVYNSNVNIKISNNFRIGDIRHNYADLTKISSELGFEPKIGFRDGINRFVKWVKTQKIASDKYNESIQELKDKRLFR